MAAVIDELCKNASFCILINLLLGFLNTATGELACANAGHVPPYLSTFIRGNSAGAFCSTGRVDANIAILVVRRWVPPKLASYVAITWRMCEHEQWDICFLYYFRIITLEFIWTIPGSVIDTG
jgi:hypothetical protein